MYRRRGDPRGCSEGVYTCMLRNTDSSMLPGGQMSCAAVFNHIPVEHLRSTRVSPSGPLTENVGWGSH